MGLKKAYDELIDNPTFSNGLTIPNGEAIVDRAGNERLYIFHDATELRAYNGRNVQIKDQQSSDIALEYFSSESKYGMLELSNSNISQNLPMGQIHQQAKDDDVTVNDGQTESISVSNVVSGGVGLSGLLIISLHENADRINTAVFFGTSYGEENETFGKIGNRNTVGLGGTIDSPSIDFDGNLTFDFTNTSGYDRTLTAVNVSFYGTGN